MTAAIQSQQTVQPALAERPPQGGYIPVLDGLRGLAILLVMLQHYMLGATSPSSAGRALLKLFSLGWVGVDLFFVLSGFLITGILLDAKGSPGYYRNFYMRRLLRIFPLYYGVLAVLFGVLPWCLPSTPAFRVAQQNQGWLWLYGANILESMGQGYKLVTEYFLTTHFWSLAVEEHFYLVWPTVIFLLPRKGILWACVAVIVGAAALRLGMAIWWGDPVKYIESMHQFTLCRLDTMASGGLLALLVRREQGLDRLMKPALWAGGAAAVLAVPVLLKMAEQQTNAHGPLRWVSDSFKYSVLAILCAALLVRTLGAGRGTVLHRLFSTRFMKFLGKYSYGLYVLHALFVPALERSSFFSVEALSVRWGSAFLGRLSYVVLASGIAMIAALLSWHLCEKHFLKLKRFFEYRRPAKPGTAAATASPAAMRQQGQQ